MAEYDDGDWEEPSFDDANCADYPNGEEDYNRYVPGEEDGKEFYQGYENDGLYDNVDFGERAASDSDENEDNENENAGDSDDPEENEDGDANDDEDSESNADSDADDRQYAAENTLYTAYTGTEGSSQRSAAQSEYRSSGSSQQHADRQHALGNNSYAGFIGNNYSNQRSNGHQQQREIQSGSQGYGTQAYSGQRSIGQNHQRAEKQYLAVNNAYVGFSGNKHDGQLVAGYQQRQNIQSGGLVQNTVAQRSLGHEHQRTGRQFTAGNKSYAGTSSNNYLSQQSTRNQRHAIQSGSQGYGALAHSENRSFEQENQYTEREYVSETNSYSGYISKDQGEVGYFEGQYTGIVQKVKEEEEEDLEEDLEDEDQEEEEDQGEEEEEEEEAEEEQKEQEDEEDEEETYQEETEDYEEYAD
ncbi:MAG: hypothetical protein M1829_002460 [Trizodia sp. TS-e1964]|nr:MAG: hypothetical protein M1829_002460 [Trizodia sp. TS-e1964]